MRTVWLVSLMALIAAPGCSEKSSRSTEDQDESERSRAPALETTAPAPSSVAVLKRLDEPLRALIFADPDGAIADQLHGYMADLARQAGVKIELEERDRIGNPAEASRFKVSVDGTLVLTVGDRHEVVALGSDRATIERNLVALDSKVKAALTKLARTPKKVAVRAPAESKLLAEALRSLDLDVHLLATDATALPPATAMFVWIDDGDALPEKLAAEVNALLRRGGSAFLAVEPGAGDRLAPFHDTAGIALDPTVVADDEHFLVRSRTAADHENLLANGFTAHAATKTTSGLGSRSVAVFLRAGSLEAANGAASATATLVRSSASAFRDANADHERGPGERADRYALGMAATASGSDGQMRVIAYADASWVGDQVIRQVRGSAGLLLDALQWLRGDEPLDSVETHGDPVGVTLTSYPRRKRKSHPSKALFKAKLEDVDRIRIVRSGRVLELRRDGGGFVATETRSGDDEASASRAVPISDKGHELVTALLAARSVRVLDEVGSADREAMALDSDDTIAVTTGAATTTLRLGGRAYGGNERYATRVGDEEIFAVTSSDFGLAELSASGLMVRDILPSDWQELEYVEIDASDRHWQLVRYGDKWRIKDHPSSIWLAETIVRLLDEVSPLEFAPEPGHGAQTVAQFSAKGRNGATATIVVHAATDDSGGASYWVTSSDFDQAGRVSASVGVRLQSALEQLAELP